MGAEFTKQFFMCWFDDDIDIKTPTPFELETPNLFQLESYDNKTYAGNSQDFIINIPEISPKNNSNENEINEWDKYLIDDDFESDMVLV
jgi:hypothetical protein